MDILLASDHAGFELKEKIRAFLKSQGHNVVDYGPHEYEENDDYPDYVAPLAQEISQNTRSMGIVIGGSGQGEAMVANRFPRVRAVVYNGETRPSDGRKVPDEISISREHNDANVLSLGSRFLSEEEAISAVTKWLGTRFSGHERHIRRIKKMDSLPPCNIPDDDEVLKI